MNNYWKITGIALLSSISTIAGYKLLGFDSQKDVVFSEAGLPSIGRLANFPATPGGDFTTAAEISTPAVVHIKASSTRSARQQRLPSIFEDFFGFEDGMGQRMQPQQAQSSGSGVIISADGYIATNNHVVEGADQLEVITSDKKTYKAQVIGTDPSSDLAVIKIDGENLATLPFANSDNVRVGEWVLAVGNPFNLESTVTAGIVSAKSRDIGILREKYAERFQRYGQNKAGDTSIESFIQTDAAVNPGNSGGALVNLRGELIGINTAIASPNGAYAGYAFAVPSSMVKKVTADIIKFGNVQRGYLGITPIELDNKKAEELDIKQTSGIYVNEVTDNGAAKAAGLKKGDVIVKIDGVETKSEPRFRELIARKRPGESVAVTVNRGGSLKDYSVTLRNRDGGKDVVKNEVASNVFEKLGVDLEEITPADKQKLGLQNGVRVKKIYPDGDLSQATDIQDGFVILKVGDTRINNIKDFKTAIETAKTGGEEGVLICGVYKGIARNYCYGLGF